jgi:hypothetical protein
VLARRGFSLVETIVAMALTIVVAAMLGATLLNALAAASFQTNRMAVARTLRYGVAFLTSELRGVSPAAGDLIAFADSSVRYRGHRGLAVTCAVGPDWVTVRNRLRFALRAWVPGRDSLRIFLTGAGASGAAHRWMRVPLLDIDAGAGVRCPDGAAATRLTTDFTTGSVPVADIKIGSPLHVFETMEVRLYPSLGTFWLGVRSVSGGGSIQPALGPFSASGLQLGFRDVGGNRATVPGAVAAIRAKLKATSPRMVRRQWPGPLQWLTDSVAFTITVR